MAMHARLVRSPSYGRRCVRPALLASLLLTATLTACGNDDSSGSFKPNGSLAGNTPGSGTPATPPPSALPKAEVNKAVLARYAEFRKLYKQAYGSNDPDQLPTVAMDPLLAETTRDIQRLQSRNEVWRFTTVSNAEVYARSRDGRTVYVADCLRTLAAYRYSLKTGKRTAGGPGRSFLHRTAVRYDQGTWKVSQSVQDEQC
jgi:hypothetical protein